MKSFYVITNIPKDPDYSLTKSVVDYLEERDCLCGFVPFARGLVPKNDKYVDPSMVPEGVEALIVIGGDGTLLQAARDTYSLNIPIIGIDLGDVGYLTDVATDDRFEALDALIADNYHIQRRMMLKGTLYSSGVEIMSSIALNDIVISKSYNQRMIRLDTSIEDTFLNSIYADGLIVASPTGSTGYSLSVGGPIIEPDAEALLITPLAPHTLSSRSVVVSGDKKITITQGTNKDGASGEAIAIFDGNIKSMMRTGDKMVIEEAKTSVQIIKLNKSSFLEVLSKKMK